MTKDELADAIADKLDTNAGSLRDSWNAAEPFGYFYLDDLLPSSLANELHSSLPGLDSLMLRATIRERKRVGVDVKSQPLVHNALYAFQDNRVVRAVERITNIADLQADPTLYASGVSAIAEGDFLNPHLDNSHDGDPSDELAFGESGPGARRPLVPVQLLLFAHAAGRSSLPPRDHLPRPPRAAVPWPAPARRWRASPSRRQALPVTPQTLKTSTPNRRQDRLMRRLATHH